MTRHFGYWVFGKDMKNVNLSTLKKNGITDIFLNYYAFTAHGKTKTLEWIKNAKNNSINVHIWVQCFYNGEWQNPAKVNLNTKLKEIKGYADLANVKGVHLDYLRYPGNAYKTSGGADAITNFVKKVRSQNPKTFLSCAVMPENDNKYYYGQDIDALGKIVDAIIPMQYKGNYDAGTSWLTSTTKNFSKKATIWSGLQTYKSDDDETQLSEKELQNDVKTCLNAGAKGAILFRYGISPNVNFTSLQTKTTTTTTATKITLTPTDIKKIATTVKEYVTKNKKLPSKFKINKKEYTYGQIAYILSYAVNNITKSVEVISVKNAEKPVGDYFDEKLSKDDYKDIATRATNYMKKNKICPNYVKTKKSKKKLRPKVFVYMMARLIVYYYEHNKKESPSAVLKKKHFQTTTTTNTTSKTTSTKLYNYLTDEGCSGMGQCTGYNCGPNSLQQCFYRLTGIHVSESTIAEVAGTTSSGTDHDGLNTAVAWFNKKYNKNIKITWKNFSDMNWSQLQQYIDKGAVFCHLLYRDQWGHYEVPKSVEDDYLLILNSLGDSCGSGTYCGYIESRSKSAQLSYINGISQKSIAILTNG